MYAVKLYSSVVNKPEGMPNNWPAEVIDIGETEELPTEYPSEDGWQVMDQEVLDTLKADNQSAYNTWYTTYKTPSTQLYIKNKILDAMSFGQGVIAEYGAQNILAGLTLTQIQTVMERTAKVQVALNTGSLYVVLTELALVEIDGTIVTESRVTEFRNKIQDYLEIPRT